MTSELEPKSAPLAADRCAVIVVDMQNDYCHESGAMAQMGNDVSRAGGIVANVRALLDLARSNGVPCILVRTTHGPWTDTPGWRSRGQTGDVLRFNTAPLVSVGSWGAEFYGIDPHPDDLVLTKHRYSAFAYTSLELALHAKQRDTALFAGTMTNACVEASAVDAVMRGFCSVLIEDCAATSSDEVHRQSIEKFVALVGPVIRLEQLRDTWDSRPEPATS